ncbi:hypothetical protein JVU11DRAFT_2889 [Chiua virens]|nr:hypothetical protein JVU11DRAFT_2889 [Chiua virens]
MQQISNVVIFGETGVGKSSLINLIAGKNICETSSSAVGCTLDYKRYQITLNDQRFAIWDTAGLDEGSQGTVPAEKAEAYLRQLIRDLAKTSGIDLLIYCVRGTRVRSALLSNYHLFYSAICRRKVPIAIAVTGLENQEGSMDSWWLQNEKQFSALKMHFDNYACVTTLQPFSVENAALRDRLWTSRTALIKMITNACRTDRRWMPTERSWLETAFSDIHSMLSARDGPNPHVASVIMCDVSRPAPIPQVPPKRSFTFQNPVTLSRSLTRPMGFRRPVSVVTDALQCMLPFEDAMKCTPERLFRVYQVPRKEPPFKGRGEERKKDSVVKRGADLLVFCVPKEDGDLGDVKLQWEHFNLTYGGDLSPQMVIIIGATDQRSAEEWWTTAVGGKGALSAKGDASITYWPVDFKTDAEAETAKSRLRELVNTCCIDCSKVDFTGTKRIFRRGTSSGLDKSLIPLLSQIRPPSQVEVQDAEQDLLTNWGVWEHVSDGRTAIRRPNTISHTLTYRSDDWPTPKKPFLPFMTFKALSIRSTYS